MFERYEAGMKTIIFLTPGWVFGYEAGTNFSPPGWYRVLLRWVGRRANSFEKESLLSELRKLCRSWQGFLKKEE